MSKVVYGALKQCVCGIIYIRKFFSDFVPLCFSCSSPKCKSVTEDFEIDNPKFLDVNEWYILND